MQVTNVTNDDGRKMANLINFLKAGRWDLSGNDADALVAVKQWVQSVAMDMASKLTPVKAASPTPEEQPTSVPQEAPAGFKIKAMGPIGSTPAKTRKKK